MNKIQDIFGKFASTISNFCSSPIATGLAFISIVVWALFGPSFNYSSGWQLLINTGTTIITFLMVFILNNSQGRDTAAINIKLDAIIIAIDKADNKLIGLEALPPTQALAIKEEIVNKVVDTPEEVKIVVPKSRKKKITPNRPNTTRKPVKK